ncbi:MAG: nitrate/nitrite two-component system sensor histidine kinase NarX, partial [Gibbsiella quercinecans]|uniref:nitrate/nitrite two-component system sensor histidine kinase NarX n=1 Tax=Gibbsiella quercinecans TaxID=929813 RepID=UPI003F3EA83A
MKRLLASLSIVHQVSLLMLLLGLLGIGGMGVSAWMSQSIQGNAHAINKAGSLRMQSYRLLAQVPLDADSERLIQEMAQDENSPALLSAVSQEGLTAQFNALRDYGQQTLLPRLRQAHHPADASAQVAHFVTLLDKLVSSIDHQTERRLWLVTLVQAVFIALTLLLFLATIGYLRQRLLHPWRQLLAMAKAIGQGNFSGRFTPPNRRHDEMASLGYALNSMSDELSAMYSRLEQRVAEKTADLQQKNQVLAFLYQASRQLHANQPLSARLPPVIEQLQALTPLQAIQVHLYENNGTAQFNPQSAEQMPATEYASRPTSNAAPHGDETTLSWRLQDKLGSYGLMVAQHDRHHPLDDEQRRLIDLLAEQLTSVLAIEHQVDHQQQLMLMEERAAIARELHDSIAQSLSCLKMQVSCLQMQGEALAPAAQDLVRQMREELNTAYRQLRELLTTFRLQLTEPGLLAALQATVQ